jgi:hypothetical protein
MKNTLSNLKKSAVFVALFASASAAYASNSEYTQPITLNAGGAETAISVAPVINANPQTTISVGGPETAIQNTMGDMTATSGDSSATGGALTSDIDNTILGDEIATNAEATGGSVNDYSNTSNSAGGAEVANSNDLSNFNGDVNGTIADNSHTINNAGGAELALQNDVSNGGVHSVNNASGAELALQNDVSNGGVTSTITDKSKTDIDASSNDQLTQEQINKQKTEVDASSENKLDQQTEVEVDNSGSGNSDVDTSNSGNSKNKNTQNTNVGGNNSSYSSYNKSGAAANIPQAAAILATKSCVSSLSVGIGGGNVYAGYGGLSFAYVGSGAVELEGTVMVDGKKVKANYTIPELANLDVDKRTPIFATLRGDDPELATCLMGNVIEKERFLTKAYEQATDVANINAGAHTTGLAIQAQAKVFIAQLEAKTKLDAIKIEALGEAFNTGVKHICLANIVKYKTGEHKEKIFDRSAPLRGEGHESCEAIIWSTFNKLSDGAPVVTEAPDFSQYLKGVPAAAVLKH